MTLPIRLAGLLALLATTLGAAGALAQGLPPTVDAALARAKLPRDAVTMLVVEVDGKSAPRLSHLAQLPVNPASVMKLVTTFAALDQLGPAFTWRTPVYLEGTLRDGNLMGNVYIKGQGDPKLVAERLWLLLRRVQGLGIRQITGDIVLDRSAFAVPPQDPGAFDGEALRPYNASPDALLVNFKSMVMSFVPDPANQKAMLSMEPPLAGLQLPPSVPLLPGACGDWRGGLKADFSDTNQVRFTGGLPASCGERVWPLAYADPRSHAVRAVAGMWGHLGGKLTGVVRDGQVPAALTPVFELQSPALADVVRDINKFSNNVMAQQVFLTLSLQQKGVGTAEGSREVIAQWWRERFGTLPPPLLDNGSGLSRDERISAEALARMLQAAWASPVMSELMSSLPITGVDGTLRRARTQSGVVAHLKTGSLRDVAGVAGYVLGASGRRYVLVAIANHANANSVRPAIEALIDWTATYNARANHVHHRPDRLPCRRPDHLQLCAPSLADLPHPRRQRRVPGHVQRVRRGGGTVAGVRLAAGGLAHRSGQRHHAGAGTAHPGYEAAVPGPSHGATCWLIKKAPREALFCCGLHAGGRASLIRTACPHQC